MVRIEKLEVKKEFSLVHSSIDIYWCQRAKQHWIIDGDHKTNFFHQATNRRKFNVIHKIKVDDEPLVHVAVEKNAIAHFYGNLYHEDPPSRPFLDGAFASISHDDARDLEKDFTENEVQNAITDLRNEKARGQMVSI